MYQILFALLIFLLWLLVASILASILVFILGFTVVLDAIKNVNSDYTLSCGGHNVSLPFQQPSCEQNRTVLQFGSNKYHVETINDSGRMIRITDPRLHKNNCSTPEGYSLSPNQFGRFHVNSSDLAVLLSCKNPVKSPRYVDAARCIPATEEHSYLYALMGSNLVASDIEDSCSIHNVLAYGFELQWSRKVPQYAFFTLRIAPAAICAQLISALALAARTVIGIIALSAFVVCKCRRRHLSSYDTIEEFLQNQNNLMPIRYSYKEIQKMTNNFKEKLGKGGFGEVYKGKSRSGLLVAVKMINKAKENGQDFINEVATIGRIYHINVVRLVGFCVTASKRALVYDYMPNGSLDKYIFTEDPNGASLSWKRAHEIAVGVARGISYLHQGCNMQILHFDIKPHNILLDESFVPKISDFGLAKLCPTRKNTVTLTGAKGTLGYIAPELIYRKIGGVSYKADVYSFGQLLLAMVGRGKVNALTDHSSRVYFSSWIYEKFDRGEEEDLDLGDITEDEKDLVRKIVLVALWCVQWTPADRPSMREVLDMLEGDLKDVKLPPKPLYYPEDSTAWDHSGDQDTGDSTLPLFEPIALEIEQCDP